MSRESCLLCQQPLAAESADGLCPACETQISRTAVTNGRAVPDTSPSLSDRDITLRNENGKPPNSDLSGVSPGNSLGSQDGDREGGETYSFASAVTRDATATNLSRFGDYEILDEIARGGMGVVFKARQISLNRVVALKMNLSAHLASAEEIQRFHLEAESAAKLDHPCIVPIFEVGQYGAQHFFTMGYVEGGSLAGLLVNGPLSPLKAAALLQAVSEGVRYAHARNIVHRDLKPANVLLDQHGHPKITDFGLAKNSEIDRGLTMTGQVMGTPAYMAPEQAAGRMNEVGPLADVYALGGILYFLLTGKAPFQGANAIEIIHQVLHDAPPSPRQHNPHIPLDMETICLKCLEKDPACRYGSAGELVAELQRFLQGHPITARPVGAVEHCWRWCKRKPSVVATVCAVLVMITGVVGVSYRMQQQARAEELVKRLQDADIHQLPSVVADLNRIRSWSAPLLRKAMSAASKDPDRRLRISLGLLPADDSQVDFLSQQLKVCTVSQLAVLREELYPYRGEFTAALWEHLLDEEQDSEERFRVAAALAEYSPADERWPEFASFVADHLTSQVPLVLADDWVQLFKPIGGRLTAPLAGIHADGRRSSREREAAAYALAQFWREQPVHLAEVILAAEQETGFSHLISALRPHSADIKQPLRSVLHSPMPDQALPELREAHWRRQAMSAVTLLHLNDGEEVWPLLRTSPDPSLRSLIVAALGQLGIDVIAFADRLVDERDLSVRQALIQCLGQADWGHIAPSDRKRIVAQLQELYTTDPDSGIHAASSWALRRWGSELPQLAPGEPEMTAGQKQEIVSLSARVEATKHVLADFEQRELPERAVDWERRLREQAQEEPPRSTQEGLVAHYRLDEPGGSRALNAVPYQPSGNYEGSGTPDWTAGVVGGALRLNGNGGRMNLGQAFHPERNNSFSYGGWFRTEDEQQSAALLAKLNVQDGYRGFDLFLHEGHIVAHIKHEWPNNSIKVVAVESTTPNIWHHYFVTYDGSSSASGVSLYFDGDATAVRVETDSLSKTILTDADLCIGSRSEGNSFRGWIDDVRFYARHLTNSEVREVYESALPALAAVPAERRSAEQQSVLTSAHRAQDERFQELNRRLAAESTALRQARWAAIRRWRVNRQGQTMVLFPRLNGANGQSVDHSFLLSSHEVTVAEFRRFQPNAAAGNSARTDDCPKLGVSWYQAAQYCNWLSAQEGIPEDHWVYVPNERGEFAAGMQVKGAYLDLEGYRLPTEVEWEYACRAGSDGTYYFGEPLSLLSLYAHHAANSGGYSHPVECLLPNDAGLFDMHGNATEWIQPGMDKLQSPIQVQSQFRYMLRGGGFADPPESLRCFHHMFNLTEVAGYTHGLRPARTFRLPAYRRLGDE